MSGSTRPDSAPLIAVPIGQWAVAGLPTVLRTLLGSCVAVILYDRSARIGGMAHIVLPDSRGQGEGSGKYVDSAIPALLNDLGTLRGRPGRVNLEARLVGGASMFRSSGSNGDVGRLNAEASERLLSVIGIPIVARDLGGTTGRNVTLDTATGVVLVRVPGGPSYEL